LSNDNTETPVPAKARKTAYVTISKELFDSVPQKRAGYLLAFAAVQLLFIGHRGYEFLRGDMPEYVSYAIIAGYFVAYVAMYIQFIAAMRIMQIHWFLIVPACIIVFFPVVGLMPLGLMDRRIAEQWDSAQQKQDQYRQRIREEQVPENETPDAPVEE